MQIYNFSHEEYSHFSGRLVWGYCSQESGYIEKRVFHQGSYHYETSKKYTYK